jgi:hypothetical protein
MQSRLYTLLLSLVVVGSAVVAFGISGLLVAAILVASVEFLRSAQSPGQEAKNVVIVLLCWLLLGLLLPFYQEARDSNRRSSCWNNLRQLSLALRGYHQHYGCFPPAYVADKDGKPMHSWRVLILPFLEYRNVFDQYDFNEPWNGPQNRKLAKLRPRLFACPSDAVAATPEKCITNYMAVVGAKTAWPGNTPTKLSDFASDGGNTILLVEVGGSDINWMEPRDLTFDEACRGINKNVKMGISSPHGSDAGTFSSSKKVAIAAFADGNVHFLPEDVAPEDLESMLTRESANAVYLDPRRPSKLGAIEVVAMIVMIVSALLLLARPRKRGVAVAA